MSDPERSHRRIPFVHRISSFRKNHSRNSSNSSQPDISSSSSKREDNMVSTDLVLRVDVIRARCLAAESNLLNPYANVRCGGIRQRTDTLRKSIDPEWLCTFEINLSADVIGHKKRMRDLRKNGLSIAVYSKDRFSSIYVGQIAFPLEQLFTEDQPLAFEENNAKWYPLLQSGRQYRRFHLRKKHELDINNISDTDLHANRAEICIHYGLVLKDENGKTLPNSAALNEDWQYLLSNTSFSQTAAYDEEAGDEEEDDDEDEDEDENDDNNVLDHQQQQQQYGTDNALPIISHGGGIATDGTIPEEITLQSKEIINPQDTSAPATIPLPTVVAPEPSKGGGFRKRFGIKNRSSSSSTTPTMSTPPPVSNEPGVLKKDGSYSSISSLTPSISNKTDHSSSPNTKRRLKFRARRRKRMSGHDYARFYSDIMGVTYLEIESAKDLPRAPNVTRTGFDMDPFVIVSYGTSTFRTRAVRHNLNPVWNEKLFFHVRSTQEKYKVKFALYDKDKFSGNDFIASQELSISDIINKSKQVALEPPVDGEGNLSEEIEKNMGTHTIELNLAPGLAKWKDNENPTTLNIRAKFVPYVEIRKMFWIALARTCDADNSNTMSRLEVQTMLETLGSNISEATLDQFWKENGKDVSQDLSMDELVKSLEAFMQMSDETQEDPNMIIEQADDVPVIDVTTSKSPFFIASEDDEYRSTLRGLDDEEDDDDIDDSDDLGDVDDYYFTSPGDDDEASYSENETNGSPSPDEADYEALAEGDGIQYVDSPLKQDQPILHQPTPLSASSTTTTTTTDSITVNNKDMGGVGKEANGQHHHHQEKVIRITECPICHRKNLGKRGQMDIVTHVATCAANDWTTVDRFLMGNFGSEAQAQRKWFVKLVSKVGYGRYSEGRNNANIIVQDRETGQLIDERMSVYVRLGMRLLYKGMRTGIQTKKAQKLLASMSVKQGRLYDSPSSKKEIPGFIKFHQLNMSEVLEPLENFNTFNEFFYRKLKPGSRPCDDPHNPQVAVSPADCRMMAFDTIDNATSLWIKGVEFTLPKLLDDAEAAKAYEGGSLAIFRLAPQDYHRFHSPVDGVITRIHNVKGQYYTVNPMAIRTTLDVYGDNKRDVVHMETEAFGKVAVVCIGAMMVGSILLTAGEGDRLARTDELGYFAFGGSTLVVLFEKNAVRFDEDLLENAKKSLETLVRVGNHIGVHPTSL